MRPKAKITVVGNGGAGTSNAAAGHRRPHANLHAVAPGRPVVRSRPSQPAPPFPLSPDIFAKADAVPAARRPRRPWPLPERRQETEVFKASLFQILRRLFYWGYAFAYYGVQRIRRRSEVRSSPAAHGVLLREALERMGGTFVKLGQQLSARLDLLPFETCNELSKMLDDMPPFPSERAVEAVERVTGKPLAETFLAFDPKPLGSASVACVYHAVLRNGEDVAVKVRRPGIGKLFAADLAALDLLLGAGEWLTLIRPGFTRAVRTEIRAMLMEELDFFGEARYQELFRQQARRDKQPVTAPRVYYRYCGKDVIVSEFVKGVWLQDLIAAKEHGDQEALQYCTKLNIDPETVAKRLLHTLYWANFENLFYHADPHPANVVVRPDSELIFLDFGACGPTTHRNRRNYVELFSRQDNRDIDGMVQVFGNIISPLPSVNLYALQREGEALTARWQYGFDSKYPEWWERSSAGMWIGMLELTRKFNIPVTIDTVRLVRSSLLYDTIAARLCDTINMQREFRKYRRGARKRTLQRMRKGPPRDLHPGQLALRFERLVESIGRHLYGLEDLADQPVAGFRAAQDKGWSAASSVFGLGISTALVTGAGMALAALTWSVNEGPGGIIAAFNATLSSPWYWGAVILLTLRCYRIVRYRLTDLDGRLKTG